VAKEEVVLYAWVGEDEFDSSMGLKQGITKWGVVPLVSIQEERMDTESINRQLQAQSNQYGKKMRLCRFVLDREIKTIEPQGK
jgi:tRNA A37 threonylcarbamoyladenosine dehydratase